ncbi:MAG TPA: hypothetical protein VIL78_01375 [Hanamia sp.]
MSNHLMEGSENVGQMGADSLRFPNIENQYLILAIDSKLILEINLLIELLCMKNTSVFSGVALYFSFLNLVSEC